MIVRAHRSPRLIVLGGGAYGRWRRDPIAQVARAPLATLPCAVESWRCAGDTPLDRKTAGRARRRRLREPDLLREGDGASQVMGLYIGYYASQRKGSRSIRRRTACPDPAGSRSLATRTSIDAGGTTLPVNRYIVQKGLNRQVVLYWYQGRGRVVANEYANKFWLMLDQAQAAPQQRRPRPHRGAGARHGRRRRWRPRRHRPTNSRGLIYPRLSPYLP